MSELFHALALLAYAVCACGIVYLAVALVATLRFVPVREGAPIYSPGITVLKPIHGLEVELFENLCSFCDQRYESFQVIFGVQRSDDPALPVIRRVMERYPHLDLRLVIDESPFAGNPKMANVAAMMHFVKHPIVVIADADMRVDPQYLPAIAAGFAEEDVGAVTCLYAADARGGFASRLGAMGINEQFAPSVLVALTLAPLSFCFGSTMAVRRTVLAKIGGIDALAPHLADDYMLGALVAGNGYRVSLSRYVTRNVISESDLASLWHHELRWARTVRSQRPLGFTFSIVTLPLPFALLSILGGNLSVTLMLTVAVLALRLALHLRMRTVFADVKPVSTWLVPVRDVFGLAIWAGSFFGRDVRWRRHELTIDRAGRVEHGTR